MIVGMDPGLKGGIVALKDGEVVAANRMPIHKTTKQIDWHYLSGCLAGIKPKLAVIEKVHAMPGQGVTSMFSFGTNYGGLLGVCAGLGIPFVLVRPQEWQKLILSGIDKKHGKGRSRIYCAQRWPGIEPLQRHDGLSDAACMALWLEQTHNK